MVQYRCYYKREKAASRQILNAVHSFDKASAPNNKYEFEPEYFKKRVIMAAAEAKRRGEDIDDCVSKLTKNDLEALRSYAANNGENRRGKDDDDNEDITSVWLYGDDEEVEEVDELESSGFGGSLYLL